MGRIGTEIAISLSGFGRSLTWQGIEARDEVAVRLLREILAYPGKASPLAPASLPIVPVGFRRDRAEYRFFSAVTTLGTAHDVTVQELRIECFFHVDRATADLARATLA